MDHRLKGKLLIDSIFTIGRSVFVYPVKMYYLIGSDINTLSTYQCGVSVSKRNLKRAVDRNLIKRRMRESLRNQIDVSGVIQPNQNIHFMLVYVTKEVISFEIIHQSIRRNLKKIKALEQINKR